MIAHLRSHFMISDRVKASSTVAFADDVSIASQVSMSCGREFRWSSIGRRLRGEKCGFLGCRRLV